MVKAKSFEFGEAFDNLNKIVEQLESGDVDLNDALKQYEEGLKLVQECKKQLETVENKVKVIRDKYATGVQEDSE
jgi:exodeoxyribonuclease VII small subunit